MAMIRFTIRDLLFWTIVVAILAAGAGSVLRQRQRPPLIFTGPAGEPAPVIVIK